MTLIVRTTQGWGRILAVIEVSGTQRWESGRGRVSVWEANGELIARITFPDEQIVVTES